MLRMQQQKTAPLLQCEARYMSFLVHEINEDAATRDSPDMIR
jgi:hypothetical protein